MRYFSLTLPLQKLLPPDLWRSGQYRNYRENIQLENTATLIYINGEINNIEKRRKKQTGNEVRGQRNRRWKQTQYFRLQGHKMQRKKTMQTDIHNQKTAEDSDTRCCECWENYVQITKADNWIERVRWSSVLHTNKCVECGRKLLRQKNSKTQKRI